MNDMQQATQPNGQNGRQMTNQNGQHATTQQQVSNERNERREVPRLVPPVDIFEDDSGLTLIADLPGIPKDALAIDVDGDVLTIEGDIKLDIPQAMEAEYAEVRAAGFRRSFTLSRELDADKAESTFNNGVLELRIPKKQQAQRRRIEVKTS